MSLYYKPPFERGFGTYPLKGRALATAVFDALEVGYRAFDTAQMYGNEADFGKALQENGAKRDTLCITTKVHPDNFSAEKFIPSVRKSLDDLQVESVDILLLHWPPQDGEIDAPLDGLLEAQALGLTKEIGVSNFNAAMMHHAASRMKGNICTNQVEFHPLLDQSKLGQASIDTGIPLSSYCSVARGEIFKYPEFAEIGGHYGKSAAQIALRWILQKGVSINTMSTKRANIEANFDIMDFTLSTPDMARIDALTQTNYRIVTAEVSPWSPDWR